MTKQDIKVGAYYKNNLNSYVYLGVGKRVMWTGAYSNKECDFNEKDLISFSFDEYHGQKVQSGDDSVNGFWDEFVEIPKIEALNIITKGVLLNKAETS